MAFVSGLMGPYMRSIPIDASVGMLLSLAVALIVTPWLSYKLLAKHLETLPLSKARMMLRKARVFTHLRTRDASILLGDKASRNRCNLFLGIMVALGCPRSAVVH